MIGLIAKIHTTTTSYDSDQNDGIHHGRLLLNDGPFEIRCHDSIGFGGVSSCFRSVQIEKNYSMRPLVLK
jgi:hypothetical protein